MASPEQIRAWLNANPNATDAEIFQAMQQNNVSPQQLQQVTGGNLASIQQRYNAQGDAVQGQQRIANEGLMRNWLGANLNANDAQIFAKMQEFGISPGQIASITGKDIGEVQSRYGAQSSLQPFRPSNQPAPMDIPTGLAGSEQALGAGYESALNSLLAGMNAGRNDLVKNSQAAQGTISDAMKQALSGFDASGQKATDQASQGFQQAQGYMSPYVQQGQQVNPLLMALSGASGQEAFNKAFAESPVQQFLLDRGNRNVTANAAATGQLGGGNVLKELTKYGQGIAGQSLQDQIGNLMGLSNQGFSAAGNASNLSAGGGQYLSGITQNTAQNKANTLMSGANSIAGIQNGLGQTLGNMGYGGGQVAGTYAMNTGQNVASGRMQTGRDLASSISGVSSGLANIARDQGTQFSDVYGTSSGNLANLLSGAGLTEADLIKWLSGNQAQTAQNASGQASGVPNTAYAPANTLDTYGRVAGGVGTLLGAL